MSAPPTCTTPPRAAPPATRRASRPKPTWSHTAMAIRSGPSPASSTSSTGCTTRSRPFTAMRACTGSDSSQFRSSPRGSRGAFCWISSAKFREADRDRRAIRAVPGARMGIAQRHAGGRAQRRRAAGQQVRLRLARLAGVERAGRPNRSRGFRQGRGPDRRHPGRACGRQTNRDPPGSDSPALCLVAFRQEAICEQDQARDRCAARVAKRRRRMARGRFRAGPERGLHDRSARLDPTSDRYAARPSGLEASAELPAGRAAGVRRVVSDHHARELPHSDARNTVRGDGAGRSVPSDRQSAARMGQSRPRAGAAAARRLAGPHAR